MVQIGRGGRMATDDGGKGEGCLEGLSTMSNCGPQQLLKQEGRFDPKCTAKTAEETRQLGLSKEDSIQAKSPN